MRALSEALNVLIATAQDVINKPQMVPAQIPGFAELATEIREAEARPAEGIRCTRAALVMLHAIEGFCESRDTVQLENPWLMLAGATLPLLRVDAYRAFRAEKERGNG